LQNNIKEENDDMVPGGFLDKPPGEHRKSLKRRVLEQEGRFFKEGQKNLEVMKLIHFDQKNNMGSNTESVSYDEMEEQTKAFNIIRKRSKTYVP